MKYSTFIAQVPLPNVILVFIFYLFPELRTMVKKQVIGLVVSESY